MRRPLKIIYLLANLGIGGVERFVVDISNEFSLNHDVCLYLTESSNGFNRVYQSSLYSNIQVKSVRFQRFTILRYFYEVFRIIHIERPDVIHIHSPSLILPLIPVILFKYKSVNFIQTIHGKTKSIEHQKFWMQKRFLRFIYRTGLVKTVAVSKTTALQFEDYYGVKCDRVIYNSRFNLCFKATSESVLHELAKFAGEGDIKLMHVSRYDKVKNQVMLIDAVKMVNSLGNSLKLFIIGNGFEGTDVENVADQNVIFLGPKENPVDYLRHADGMCLTSFSEAMPLVLIESMSVGCIPICTKVGGIGEIIVDGENGFLASEVNLETYCNALLNFLKFRNSISKSRIINDFSVSFDPFNCYNSYNSIYCDR